MPKISVQRHVERQGAIWARLCDLVLQGLRPRLAGAHLPQELDLRRSRYIEA